MTATDLRARKVLMAALLYYRHSVSIMSDEEFDHTCARLARRWEVIDERYQWQLGSADELRATGHHFRITVATEGGARAWARDVLGLDPPQVPTTDWTWCPKRQLFWTRAEK